MPDSCQQTVEAAVGMSNKEYLKAAMSVGTMTEAGVFMMELVRAYKR